MANPSDSYEKQSETNDEHHAIRVNQINYNRERIGYNKEDKIHWRQSLNKAKKNKRQNEVKLAQRALATETRMGVILRDNNKEFTKAERKLKSDQQAIIHDIKSHLRSMPHSQSRNHGHSGTLSQYHIKVAAQKELKIAEKALKSMNARKLFGA